MHEPARDWKLINDAIFGYAQSPGVYRDASGRLHALNARSASATANHSPSNAELNRIPVQLAAGRNTAQLAALLALLLCGSATFALRSRR
jgi:hypothetical protein